MRTLQKLEAAEFHLNQMKANLQDRKKFTYFLDAFLSCSRSVTFVLQAEFKKHPAFEGWYKQKQDELRGDPVCSFFVQMRNVTVKEGTPDTKVEANVTLGASFTIGDSVSIKLTRGDGREVRYETPQPVQKTNKTEKKSSQVTKYYFLEYDETDIISLCTEYLHKLIALIEEAKLVLDI